MNDIFKSHGLLMIDAAYPLFRQMESESFIKLIHYSSRIAEVVIAKEAAFERVGYGKPIEAKEDAANLFYVKDGERFLLERRSDQFVHLNANIKFTEEQLVTIAMESPQQLSNNVVTRPLMQEMMLPVLAFVGGPGELAYWATLKDAFDVLELQMPIFAPRLNITFINRQVEQILNEKSLTVKDIFEGKEQEMKAAFLSSIKDQQAKNQLVEMENYILSKYSELATHLTEQHLDLEKLLEKNKENHVKQFNFFGQKIQQAIEMKHEVALRQYDTLKAELMPNGGYQERAFSPYQYMNVYGLSLIDDFLSEEYELSNEHLVVYF